MSADPSLTTTVDGSVEQPPKSFNIIEVSDDVKKGVEILMNSKEALLASTIDVGLSRIIQEPFETLLSEDKRNFRLGIISALTGLGWDQVKQIKDKVSMEELKPIMKSTLESIKTSNLDKYKMLLANILCVFRTDELVKLFESNDASPLVRLVQRVATA